MALKKPSDFFGEKIKTSFDFDQEEVNSADSKNISKIQEEFVKFKGDYKEVNDFVLTFESFKDNVEKIDNLYEAVDLLKEDIESFARKEELDSAIMAQLLFVEKSVDELKKNVRATNSKTILEIKNDFQDLESSVNEFLSIDAPYHKKSVKESEIRVDKKLDKFKVEIDENFEFIQNQVSSKLLELSENLRGINQDSLSSVYERIDEVSEDLNNILKKEFPKFNKFFVESEIRIEKKVDEIDYKVNEIDDKIDAIEGVYESRVASLKKTIDSFIEEEIPKYKKIIVESKLNSESEIKDLENLLNSRINDFSNSLNTLEENNNAFLNDIKSEFLVSKEKIDSISKTYENLYKDFKNREIHENRKLESFSEEINSLKETLNNNLESYSKDSKVVFENFESDVEELRQQIENKISTLKVSLEENILLTEKNIKEQDTNIEILKVSLKNLSNKLKEELLSETSEKIDKKILYLEEVLEKFNEKTILNEGNSLLTDLPSTKTQDPLTPLDQKFVTFEDLANHYRTFINRVQIQMASIGGGGAGFIKDLSDVNLTGLVNGNTLVWNTTTNMWEPGAGGGGGGGASGIGLTISDTAPVDTATYPLWYDSSIGRGFVYYNDGTSSQWVEFNPAGGGGSSSYSQTLDQVLGYGNTSSLGMSVGVVTATSFDGNATSATYATTAGVSTSVIGGIGSITQLRVSGVSTLGITTFTGAVSFGTSAYFGTNDNLVLGNNNNLQLYYNGSNSLIDASVGLILKSTSTTYQGDVHTLQNSDQTKTYATFISSGSAFYQNNNTKLEIIGAGITVTGTTFTNSLRVSGVTTSTGGFVGDLTGNASSATYATTAGVSTYATTAGIATYATTTGVSTSVSGGTASVTQLQVTGVSTFTNGPVLVGSGTSTGTASQPLQVTGGGYFSGNVGIGTTIATETLSVLPKLQILNNSNADGRIILRAKPGNSYRWNLDNDGSTNNLRFFREDDATAANGTVPLSITPTGNATLSGNLNSAGNYYVKVARTSNQTITTLSDTVIAFSSVSDPNSWFNAGNSRITPNVAGNYYISAMVNWAAGAATNTIQTNIQIRKTGTTIALSQIGIQTHAYTMNITAIATLNGSTDYIELTAYTGNPTSQVVTGDASGTLTKLELFKLN